MSARISFLFCFSAFVMVTFGQQPKYTMKHFVTVFDTAEFKVINPQKDGFIRTYIPGNIQIFDLDDNNTTFIKGGVAALMCFEGQLKKGKREGVFNIFIMDSLDHSKRYKIWEQTFANNKLNGQWKTYTLQGTLKNFETFKDDSLNGISRNFWIDGKTIMGETEYFNGRNKLIQRDFYKTGKLKSEIPVEGGIINGTGKKYYESGKLQELAEFKNGEFNGLRKYYYPNGQVWIEQIYKEGKSWTVVANYTDKGEKRDAGTLKDGNGTIIFYNEDGSVREIATYMNGEQKK